MFGRFCSQTGPDSGPVLQLWRFILVMLPHDKTSHLYAIDWSTIKILQLVGMSHIGVPFLHPGTRKINL